MAAKRVFREKIGAWKPTRIEQASRPNLGPHERLLWSNPSIALGSFDSSPADEDFETAGEIGDRPAIAFSRTAVGIAHAKRAPVFSDGTVAVLHTRTIPTAASEWTRAAIIPIGFRSTRSSCSA